MITLNVSQVFQKLKKNVFKTNYPKKKFKFIIGDVKDTLKKKNPKKYFFITTRYRLSMSPTKEELSILFPRLSKGGVLIIDDYKTWVDVKKQ